MGPHEGLRLANDGVEGQFFSLWRHACLSMVSRVFRFSGAAFVEGVETHEVDGCEVRVYSAAKTIADCFKFRNKLGIDIALQGLKRYLAGRKSSVDELMRFARVCRVETVMRPYVEALL